MRKRLLTLKKRESTGRMIACKDHAATKHPAVHQGRAEGRLHMLCPPKHQENHGAAQQILLLTEARGCQSADWAQYWAQLEMQGPATHWALFCLSEKHQLLAPGSYWHPNWTEPAAQRELAVALYVDTANLFSARTDTAPLEHVLHWFNPCAIPRSLGMVHFSSRASSTWSALCENLLSVNKTFALMRQLKWAHCKAYKNYWHS